MFGITWRTNDGTIETRSFETEAERSAWAERFAREHTHYALGTTTEPPVKQQIPSAPTASERKAARTRCGRRGGSAPHRS
jgi:hypothetical protein